MQPSFHCIANIGDATPLLHGGAFVMVDKRGCHSPELLILEPSGSDRFTPGAKEDVIFWDVETTDTFAGEANYCWVRRELVCTPADTDKHKHRVVRMLRSAAGLTNTRATFCDHGDMIRWDWRNACIVTFAVPRC